MTIFSEGLKDYFSNRPYAATWLFTILVLVVLGLTGCASVAGNNSSHGKSTKLRITTQSIPNGKAHAPYKTALAAVGGMTPYSWAISGGSLPPGLNLNSSSGIISGTPTQSGFFSVMVEAQDPEQTPPQITTKAFSLTVAPGASPIQISSFSLLSGQVGSAYGVTLNANGGSVPYSWSLSGGSLPAGLSLSSSGQISGTPTASGTASFTVNVADSSSPTESATANLSIVVGAVVAPVQITTSSLPGGQVNTAYSAALAASGGTTPYSWSLSAGSLPAGLSLSSSGQISGTPTGSGTVSFTVMVTDSSSTAKTATSALSIAVGAVVTPVQITTSSLPGGQVNTAYSAALAASGGTAPYSWSLSAGSLPAGLSLSSSGQISGTPTGSGTVSFTVMVTDSSSTAKTATSALSIVVTVSVSPVQITTTSLPDGQVSSTYSTTLTATGGTKPYAFSIVSGSLPSGLSLGSSNGQINGLPTATGTSSFTVSVKDSSSPQQTDSQVLSIFISATTTGTAITSCQTLGSSGSTYVLQNDVSAAGTCFTLSADNVKLDLNGHTVTYNTSNQTSPVHAIQASSFNNVGFTVLNGSLVEGTASVAGSHVIDMGTPMSGPTVYNVRFTWSAPFSQALQTSYGNSSVAGGAIVHDNTLNNNSTSACNAVSCRDTLQAASIRIADAIRTTTSSQIYSNTITGGPQGAIVCDAPGCLIHDNILNPGVAATSNSNDFAIWCWASCNAYNNTIMTPLTAGSSGRGVEISGIVASTVGANVHNNTIGAIEKAVNTEYGGCELGGAYGVQFDDNGTGATAQSNTVTVTADVCWGTGLRLTDTETQTNVSQNNTYSAVRKTSGSSACNFIGTGGTTGCAYGVGFSGPTGFKSIHDTFQADSADFFFDWDGASGVTFVSPNFLKGVTNPSPGFHTFVFRNGGTPATVHLQDATFGTGTSAIDTDMPARGGNNQAANLYIEWTQTVTVNKSSGPAAGATVTYTDALGGVFSGTTDSSGVATIVVPQYRLNNDTAANGIENHNPFSRKVSLSGCSTDSVTGLSIAETNSVTIPLGGC